MTSVGNGNPFVYVVKLSAKATSVLKAQHLEAALAGSGKKFISSLRQIHDRIRTDPKEFGEPLYRLPALKLIVYQAVVSPLVAVLRRARGKVTRFCPDLQASFMIAIPVFTPRLTG
jgi:hypothetical protein